jgi:hypothetical protein
MHYATKYIDIQSIFASCFKKGFLLRKQQKTEHYINETSVALFDLARFQK